MKICMCVRVFLCMYVCICENMYMHIYVCARIVVYAFEGVIYKCVCMAWRCI